MKSLLASAMAIVIMIALLATLPAIGQCVSGTQFGVDPSTDGGENYVRILDNANSIVFTMDNQTRLTYMNPYGLKYFGFSSDELVGKSIIRTFVPATSTSGQDLAFMVKDIVVHPEKYISNKNQNIKKNGERVDVLWSNSAIRDKDGNVVEIISVGKTMS